MTKEEKSLLLFLETCAVDSGGEVDSRHMNADDFKTAEKWKKSGYILFGRICSVDISNNKTNWVELSDCAWSDAHKERKERFSRINSKRTWKKTEELRK
jgi:hypothetical protein